MCGLGEQKENDTSTRSNTIMKNEIHEINKITFIRIFFLSFFGLFVTFVVK